MLQRVYEAVLVIKAIDDSGIKGLERKAVFVGSFFWSCIGEDQLSKGRQESYAGVSKRTPGSGNGSQRLYTGGRCICSSGNALLMKKN